MTHKLSSSINIDLPDLHLESASQADSILATQIVYDVTDFLVQQFRRGMLPLDHDGGTRMNDFAHEQSNRLTNQERKDLYSNVLGAKDGAPPTSQPNHEFNDLWSRFLTSVVIFVSPASASATQRDLTLAARNLASNLSIAGHRVGHLGAKLRTEIKSNLRLLSTPGILHALRAQDLWQVVDPVASSELGETRNIVRSRTTATSGAVLIRWLSQRVSFLAPNGSECILNVHAFHGSRSRSPMVTPTDRDLIEACQNLLAVAEIV
jgi:hypothetical protein